MERCWLSSGTSVVEVGLSTTRGHWSRHRTGQISIGSTQLSSPFYVEGSDFPLTPNSFIPKISHIKWVLWLWALFSSGCTSFLLSTSKWPSLIEWLCIQNRWFVRCESTRTNSLYIQLPPFELLTVNYGQRRRCAHKTPAQIILAETSYIESR